MSGVVILGVCVVAALGFGWWRLRTDGRFGVRTAESARRVPEQRQSADSPEEPASAAPPEPASVWSQVVAAGVAAAAGERATLVQFSSAFCAPCRATRRVLGEVAEVVPGIAHVEIDAEAHLALVRELRIMRTPTTLVLDARGAEVARAGGAPTKQQVLAGLDRAIDRDI